MASDAFMWLENPSTSPPVKGETKDATYSAKSAFEFLSFSWGVENHTSISSGTIGSGAGKSSFSTFNITKPTDSATPSLLSACASGGHFDDATVVLRRAGGASGATGTVYYTCKFKQVFVRSMQWDSAGTDETPIELCSFSFGACLFEYTPQNADGTPGRMQSAAWSVTKNTAVFEI